MHKIINHLKYLKNILIYKIRLKFRYINILIIFSYLHRLSITPFLIRIIWKFDSILGCLLYVQYLYHNDLEFRNDVTENKLFIQAIKNAHSSISFIDYPYLKKMLGKNNLYDFFYKRINRQFTIKYTAKQKEVVKFLHKITKENILLATSIPLHKTTNKSRLLLKSKALVYNKAYNPTKNTHNNIVLEFPEEIHDYEIDNVFLVDNYHLFKKQTNNDMLEYIPISKHGSPFVNNASGLSSLIYLEKEKNLLYFTGCVLSPKGKAVLTIPEAILLAGKGCLNYFHWIIEYIVKSQYISPSFLQDKVIIVPDFLEGSQFEFLSFLLPKANFLFYKPNSHILFINKLNVIDTPVYLSDDVTVSGPERFYIMPEPYQKLRELIINNYKPKLMVASTLPKRIFIYRHNRGLTNMSLIKPLLKKYNISIVDPSRYTLEQQVCMFYHAEFICGPAGAAFTNLIFCQPGCKVLLMTNLFNTDNCVFTTIAKIFSLEIEVLYGPSKGGLKHYTSSILYEHAGYFQPYPVPIKDLEQYLQTHFSSKDNN